MSGEQLTASADVREQAVAIFLGDSSVVMVTDRADAYVFDSLSPIQRTVTAARLRALVALLDQEPA